MPHSVRPWITAGAAMMGASVIVVAPLEPVPPADVRIAHVTVELTAAPNPFEYYPQVLLRSLARAGERLDAYIETPFPVVEAVARNQQIAAVDIVNAVSSLDPAAIVHATLNAAAQPNVSLVKVVASGEPFATSGSLLLRLTLPIVSGVIAAGSAVGDAFTALFDLDAVGVVSAVINIPARTVDGFLNGHADGISHSHYGLLDPVLEAPVGDQLTGPVAFLTESLQDIGDAISSSSSASALAPAGDIADLAAPAVTLPVAPEGSSNPDSSSTPEGSTTPESPAAPEGTAAQDEPEAAEVTPHTPTSDDSSGARQTDPEPAEPEPPTDSEDAELPTEPEPVAPPESGEILTQSAADADSDPSGSPAAAADPKVSTDDSGVDQSPADGDDTAENAPLSDAGSGDSDGPGDSDADVSGEDGTSPK